MENIIQSLVKIIIIGSLLKTTLVACNRHFLPPPFPYHPNGDYYIPSFAAPYHHEPLPVYYREENPPISYQNINSYNPPQLFHQNKNYNPSQLASPDVRYLPSQIFPYKPNFHQPYKTLSKLSLGLSQVNFRKPTQIPIESLDRSAEAAQKKPAFYATNIIIKEESQQPYFNDDYNKNYHDEDYSDNYSDESPSQPNPCLLNSPYRFFESPKSNSDNPIAEDKFTLCNPHFQPNFGNSIYAVKMPITLLPSRFPPRVEQLIERIQNYFSTYTQQETAKPQNQTLTTITAEPITEGVSLVVGQINGPTENLNKKNTTGGNEESNFEQTTLNLSEAVTDAGANDSEQVTLKTTVTVMQTDEEETPSTAASNIQSEKEPQMIKQSMQTSNKLTETAAATTEAIVVSQGKFPANEQPPKNEPNFYGNHPTMEISSLNEKSPENQTFAETETQMMDVKSMMSTTESTVKNNRTEEIIALKDESSQLNVTDSYG